MFVLIETENSELVMVSVFADRDAAMAAFHNAAERDQLAEAETHGEAQGTIATDRNAVIISK